MRIAEVHRDRLRAIGESGDQTLLPDKGQKTGEFAVGDWVLSEPENGKILKLLERKSLLQRFASATENRNQLIAANVDTLFIVSSCNSDFKVDWIELFLAMAREAGVHPVVVLTKVDLIGDPREWIEKVEALAPWVSIIAINGREADQVKQLYKWCGPGQTVALVGSSGVGKSTLLNGLGELTQATGHISESAGLGRHTTTSRSLHQVKAGGWVIDTPGIRVLHLHHTAEGIDSLFEDIVDYTSGCRFRDCAHENEPGCAVQKAISEGLLDRTRFERWSQLRQDNKSNTQTVGQSQPRGRKSGKGQKSRKSTRGRR